MPAPVQPPATLKAGDVVTLKSDLTVKMTVESLRPIGEMCCCVWVDGKRIVKEQIPAIALKVAP